MRTGELPYLVESAGDAAVVPLGASIGIVAVSLSGAGSV